MTRARFPCRGCFLRCEWLRDVKSKAGGGYPCGDALRVWAHAHMSDEGDELGYVHERTKDERKAP